jgi:ligand-binding sensor domain-containing protein
MNIPIAANRFILAFLLAAAPLFALDLRAKTTDLVHTKCSGGDVSFGYVVDIAQTQDGTLWIAASARLFRFDGIRFIRFEPLSKIGLRNLLATRDGNLWVDFVSGRVIRLSRGNITTFPLSELAQTNALAEDIDGSTVAVTANGGLARFRDGA